MSSRPASLDARNAPPGTDERAETAGSTHEAMKLRGIRGATTASANTKEAILEAASELLNAILSANNVQRDDIASVFFSTTHDLNAEFPAVAARQMGWSHIALECLQEMDVPGSLPMCIRITMHINTAKRPEDLQFVYLREARALRPDLLAEE